MVLNIKKAKDEKEFENKVANLKAILIQESINQLSFSSKIKEKIKKQVIQKLQTN